MSAGLERLLDEAATLAQCCRGQVTLVERGTVSDSGPGAGSEELDCVELGPRGGEWVEVGVGPALVRLSFAGWTERLSLDTRGPHEEDEDEDDIEELCALALDFVAAAIFGELRVVESRLRGTVLRRSLEVCVDGGWRRYGKRGRLGLAGTRAWIRRELDRQVRDNVGRVARPKALRAAGPRGLPGAPWVGAAGIGVDSAAAELPVDGELDLHNFSPKEVAPLVREYIEVCRARGIRNLRIVHGKGKGVLRRTVHSILDKHPEVEDYRLGGQGEGSWGATMVRLRAEAGATGGREELP